MFRPLRRVLSVWSSPARASSPGQTRSTSSSPSCPPQVRDRLMRAWHQLPSSLRVYNQIMYRGLNIPSGQEHCSLFFYYNSSLFIIQGQHPLNILKIILKPFMPEFGLRLRSTGWQGTIWRDSTVILYILQYVHIRATGGALVRKREQ